MKISIITVCFNAAKTIEDTIESVLDQDYIDVEYIIKDGVSTDDTLSILEKYQDRVMLISKSDKGIYDAMNQGIELATGEVIGILNADDVYAHNKVISNVMRLFAQGAQATYADLEYVKEDDLEKVTRRWVSGSYKKVSFLKGWMPPHPTFYLRKEFYLKYGVYLTTMKSAADYELMLRMLYKHDLKAEYLDETIVKMRVGGVSNSSIKNRIEANNDDRKAWEINGLKPKWYTLYLKPISKISQFLIK
jgi:glycosyltransferase involved in cell wall biosynthesis